mgnify:CR=1 FL=1
MTVTLTPGAATLAQLHSIWADKSAVTLTKASHDGIMAAHAMVAKAASGGDAVYGINTGFGELASVKIAPADVATLQRNLILSHCCGVGEPLDEATTRLMMVLKLLSLGRGASGVAMTTVEIIEAMLAKGVVPVIPSQGSVGASGDLAPLAHMAAAMIGAAGAIATFLVTLSFFVTTPGVFLPEHGTFAISVLPGQFLLKDLVLLAASVWAFTNARDAVRPA